MGRNPDRHGKILPDRRRRLVWTIVALWGRKIIPLAVKHPKGVYGRMMDVRSQSFSLTLMLKVLMQ